MNAVCFQLEHTYPEWSAHSSLFFDTEVCHVPSVTHPQLTRFVVTDDNIGGAAVESGHPVVTDRSVFR